MQSMMFKPIKLEMVLMEILSLIGTENYMKVKVDLSISEL
jgi:hypothetical protein